MLLTDGMVGQSGLCGKHCSRWPDVITARAKKDQGAITLVLDLADAFERVSLPVVWVWAPHFDLLRKMLPLLCEYHRHQRHVQCEGCVADPDHRSHPPRVEMEVLVST